MKSGSWIKSREGCQGRRPEVSATEKYRAALMPAGSAVALFTVLVESLSSPNLAG